MSAYIHHLSVLGLAPGANIDEIKRAYRLLAKTHHPDAGGSAEKFNSITISYDFVVNNFTPQKKIPPKPAFSIKPLFYSWRLPSRVGTHTVILPFDVSYVQVDTLVRVHDGNDMIDIKLHRGILLPFKHTPPGYSFVLEFKSDGDVKRQTARYRE